MPPSIIVRPKNMCRILITASKKRKWRSSFNSVLVYGMEAVIIPLFRVLRNPIIIGLRNARNSGIITASIPYTSTLLNDDRHFLFFDAVISILHIFFGRTIIDGGIDQADGIQ